MDKDWEAVAEAIQARLAELGMTQAELAQRAGVALMTVRELQRNLRPRRRSPRTLAAVSEALGWPKDHLAQLLEGQESPAKDPVCRELDGIRSELEEIRARLAVVEGKVVDGEG